MERSLAKLIKELDTRPPTVEEIKTLIATIVGQDKQSKIEALAKRLKVLRG